MFTIGDYTVQFYSHGYLRLDGGSMFGSVPRPLWERKIPPDEKHRIRLSTRSLLIRGSGRVILVDVGCGDKWGEKERSIFAFEPPPEDNPPLNREEVTDVILTHLHFDHAGGMTYMGSDGGLQLTYPNARVYIQEKNFLLGKNPNIRERSSYLESHILPLEQTELHLLKGSAEPIPGIWVHPSDGHTEGLQYLEIRDKNETLYFPSDLIPTSAHLPLPYHMGYDMCAATLLAEKEPFLTKAVSEGALVVFEHDPEVAAVRVGKNKRGHFDIQERVF